VPDHGHIVLDVWIAIEKLVASPPDQEAGEHKDDHCHGERDTQRWEPACSITAIISEILVSMRKKLSTLSIGCSNASGGFSRAT
jgi:hypothetical protein